MLKAHQACIDLERNCLRIQGQEIKFLSDHELPAKARSHPTESEDSQLLQDPGSSGSSSGTTQNDFPGTGNRLAAPPSSTPSTSRPSPPNSNTSFPETAIRTLIDLGATREAAIEALRHAGGNVDVAGAMLFDF